MEILKTLENCIAKIDLSIVKDKTFYIEVNKENYDLIDTEIGNAYTLQEAKIPDMGKGKVLVFNGYKFVVVSNNRDKGESFYLAFKTSMI